MQKQPYRGVHGKQHAGDVNYAVHDIFVTGVDAFGFLRQRRHAIPQAPFRITQPDRRNTISYS